MPIIQHLTKVSFFKINTQKIHVATSTLQNLPYFRHFSSKKTLPYLQISKKSCNFARKID